MDLFNNTDTIEKVKAKPFIKWAGGKSKLLPLFKQYYPNELKSGLIDYYFEPFLGGASVFFDIAQKYEIKKSYLSDSNIEIVLVYKVIKERVEDLRSALNELKKDYCKKSETKKENFFYNIRDKYNNYKISYLNGLNDIYVYRASQMIFLNKTCFNGLYRLNRSGDFNVPFGKYIKPGIYSEENLLAVSEVLQNTEIEHGDFEFFKNKINSKSFVYFDPPYRPISNTSSFNSYSKEGFNNDEQIRLAEFYKKLDEKGAKLMLSNSDPKNINKQDNFFDELYSGFNINRIDAVRVINSNAEKRGKIKELLITNY
ncbi:MAG: Dam family site-specific DNA-(adenine-N6)-methyltransferase [Ignavibacteria bacterium]|nr:Dam family site-specific DNA-(adenine-N6)-methyltransferase [Ignavibacteria bacterium]